MADQGSFEDILNDPVPSITVDAEMESCVEELKVALHNVDQKLDANDLSQKLERCMSYFQRELLEEKVFSQILPATHRFLEEVIRQIDALLTNTSMSNVLTSVKEKLFNCESALQLYQSCVERVSAFGKISISYVKSLPENLPRSIKLIFDHCRASSRTYGSLLENASHELTRLFRTANGILKRFLTTLEAVIVFDTNVEAELRSLLGVVRLIGSVVALTNGLDLKTFVEIFVFFAKIAVTHHDCIKKTSPMSVVLPLQEIVREIVSLYSSVLETDGKTKERTLKCVGIVLSILNKSMAAYYTYLNDDILSSLVRLLSLLHRKNESTESNISKGTALLLSIITKSDNFKKSYFDYGTQMTTNKLDYHMLTLAIMKTVIALPDNERSKWIFGTNCLLETAFENINYLQREFCAEDLKLSQGYEFEEESGPMSLYMATLVPICVLISRVSVEQFPMAERLLLKQLLSGKFWVSLLSSDVWYFLGRRISFSLCAHYVEYFMQVYFALSARLDSFEVVMLRNLIGRLYALLPENAKHSVIACFKTNAHLLTPFVKLMPSRTVNFLRDYLTPELSDIPNMVENLYHKPVAKTWIQLTRILPAAGQLGYIKGKETMGALSKLWNSISTTIETYDQKQFHMLSEFIINLLEGTQPRLVLEDSGLMLNAIVNVCLYASPCVKIKLTKYLENLTAEFKERHMKKATALAELNCRLLDDKNPWVHQEALESFDRSAHLCLHEDLVSSMAYAVSENSAISEIVPAYLSGTRYYEFQDIPDTKAYLSSLCDSRTACTHACPFFEDSRKDAKMPKLEELCSKELNERVNKVCQELCDILQRKQELGEESLQRLCDVLNKFSV